MQSYRPNDQHRPQRILSNLRPQDHHIKGDVRRLLILGPFPQVVDIVYESIRTKVKLCKVGFKFSFA